MKKQEIKEWLGTNRDKTELHAPLVRMICVFEDEDSGEVTEIGFAVPIKWLCDYKQKETEQQWSWENVKSFLDNEYTSEDSQKILESAILDGMVAFWQIN